jgi:DivIVA domain-containing protein
MPLTPADIHNTAFKKPPIGKRGYDEEEVDAFLDEVEQELIRLVEENAALQGQVQGGRSGAVHPAASTMVLDTEFAEISAQLEQVQQARARAEQNARSIQAQLEQARRSVPPAPAPSEGDGNSRVLAMAQRTADGHMLDARLESEALLVAARGKSEQITSEAQLKASTLESDARRNHTAAMNSLETNRAALLDEIDRLGQLAQSYQAALNSHIALQLEELNGAPPGGDVG